MRGFFYVCFTTRAPTRSSKAVQLKRFNLLLITLAQGVFYTHVYTAQT